MINYKVQSFDLLKKESAFTWIWNENNIYSVLTSGSSCGRFIQVCRGHHCVSSFFSMQKLLLNKFSSAATQRTSGLTFSTCCFFSKKKQTNNFSLFLLWGPHVEPPLLCCCLNLTDLVFLLRLLSLLIFSLCLLFTFAVRKKRLEEGPIFPKCRTNV